MFLLGLAVVTKSAVGSAGTRYRAEAVFGNLISITLTLTVDGPLNDIPPGEPYG
jgi:hypothetical protein